MQATVPLRTSSTYHAVKYVTNENEQRSKVSTFKCWLCKSSTHWPDQCLKLATLSLEERLRTITPVLAALKEREENVECPTVAEEHNVQKQRTASNANTTIILCYSRIQTSESASPQSWIVKMHYYRLLQQK